MIYSSNHSHFSKFRTLTKWSLGASVIVAIMATSLLAESRVWTSTSGSKIQAEYLGTFDEVAWFQSGERLLKMPSKYISASDLQLIEDDSFQPVIPVGQIDATPESIALLDQLWTTQAPLLELDDQGVTLSECFDRWLAPLQNDDPEVAPLVVKFTRRSDSKKRITTPPKPDSLYHVITATLASQERTFELREGSIVILRKKK